MHYRPNEDQTWIKYGPYPEAKLFPGVNATNGAVYTLDAVLIPPTNLTSTLQTANLTSFLDILQASNMTSQLEEAIGLTVFVPVNIDNASSYTSDPSMARSFIENHTVIDNTTVYYSPLLLNHTVPSPMQTLGGTSLNYTAQSWSNITINDTMVVNADVLLMNGVIHIIESPFSNSTSSGNSTPGGGGPLGPTGKAGASSFFAHLSSLFH